MHLIGADKEPGTEWQLNKVWEVGGGGVELAGRELKLPEIEHLTATVCHQTALKELERGIHPLTPPASQKRKKKRRVLFDWLIVVTVMGVSFGETTEKMVQKRL